MTWHRRFTVVGLAAMLAGAAAYSDPHAGHAVAFGPATKHEAPGSGTRVQSMQSYDSIIPAFMARYGVPGASIAVMRNGKLVFARGYGYADMAAKTVVTPTTRFRIASVSKPITAAAIMKLVDAGQVDLDSRAFGILYDVRPANVRTMDQRWMSVTVRQLLSHSGGLDRDVSGDPMFMSTSIANAMGTTPPADLLSIIRFRMSTPLDFAPGTKYAYSNLGYAILGLIIERVSGTSYESYVKTKILKPAGVNRMELGRTLLAQRAPDETRYYDRASATSVFPSGGTVPSPDGGFYLEPMAAHGGWIASAPDLLRFVAAVDGYRDRPDILSPAAIAAMTAKSSLWSGTYWYGLGWSVNSAGNWWHNGSLPGSTTLLVRTSRNVSWVALLNSRTTPAGATEIGLALDREMWAAHDRVSAWPAHDLFDRY